MSPLLPAFVDELEFHRQMAESYAEQRAARRDRPDGISLQDWKNRHRVSAKLAPNLYADLMALCRTNEWSVNTALNQILTQHFNA